MTKHWNGNLFIAHIGQYTSWSAWWERGDLAKKNRRKKGNGEHTQTKFFDNSPAFTCCTDNLKPLTKLTTHLQEAHDVGFIKVQHRKA